MSMDGGNCSICRRFHLEADYGLCPECENNIDIPKAVELLRKAYQAMALIKARSHLFSKAYVESITEPINEIGNFFAQARKDSN